MRWRVGKFSLLTKIVVALCLVGLLPLFLASIQLFRLNRRAFADHVLRLHAVTARTTAAKLNAELSARKALVTSVAQSPILAGDPRGSASSELLAGLLTAPGGLDAVSAGVFNADGGEILRAQRRGSDARLPSLLSQSAQPGLRLVQMGDAAWLVLQVQLSDSGSSVRAIFDVGFMTAILTPVELGDTATLCLVDRQGDVVLSSGAIGQSNPTALLDQAKSQRISGAGEFRAESGTRVLGAFAPLGTAPWSVVSWQPLQIAQAIERSMKQRALLAVLLAVALTLGLSSWAFFGIVRPLRTLVKDHWRLGGSPQPGAGKDEISQLRAAFSALEKHISESKVLDEVFLGRYQVIHRVGSGAMGTVFRGWDPKLKRPVALKTIRLEEAHPADSKPHQSTQLLHEAISAARISHENVISVYDVEDTPEFGFVAMEYVDGMTLGGFLGEGRILRETEIVHLALAIARGLSAAHAQGIVHRDIKPANVLLGREGQIKIADFGISQLMSSLTGNANQVFGTPGYLPPETLNGKGFGPAGDLFALGVLMYRCATGRRPFGGENDRRVLINTLTHDPDPPRALNSDISNDLNDIIMSLLEKDPTNRIQTAERLIDLLSRLAGDAHWVFAPSKEEWNDGETFSFAPSQLVDTLDFVMERDRRR